MVSVVMEQAVNRLLNTQAAELLLNPGSSGYA
jgi:hypothetical protein